MGTPRTAADAISEIAEAYHELSMAADPLAATANGLPEHRDRMPDLSLDTEVDTRGALLALQRRAAAVDLKGLTSTDLTTRHMLLECIGHDVAWIDGDWTGLSVDDFDLGASARLMYHLPRTTVADDDHAGDHVKRLAGVGEFLDVALDRHRGAARAGLTPPVRGVRSAINRLRATSDLPLEGHPFLTPFEGHADVHREAATRAMLAVVGPALQRHADGLEADLLPLARPDDRAGLCWLDDGAPRYVDMLRFHVTTSRPDPEAIHDAGLRRTAELHAEMAVLGEALYGVTDPVALGTAVRADTSQAYADAETLLADAQAICDRAEAASVDLFGRHPTTSCRVKVMSREESMAGGMAMYEQPTVDRDHGTYWVNAISPALPINQAEVTAFHEATPGHHTQMALQTELDLPSFRRLGRFWSGHGEGWGLYTERLADELGWYSSDHSRLGMLIADTLRACRMVVDTGLHHFGWSRQAAVEHLSANAPIDAELVANEVDRYLVFPGQAPSYTVGQQQILALREKARTALGPAFSLAGFHDVVLGQGGVPLSVLDAMVDRWIAGG